MKRWEGYSGLELAQAWGIPLVEAYETIGSTNDRAAELGRTDVRRPVVVIAEEQTAGRGRRGDRWQSGAGAGIWMSVLLDARAAVPQLPLVVGVACARAVEGVLSDEHPLRVGVKWPNDLMIGDRKLGGILCESGPFGVVIGVGLNLRTPDTGFDAGLSLSATTLEDTGAKSLSSKALAAALVDEIVRLVSTPDAFEGLREELRARDALVGRRITTEALGPGVARGIDEDGGLLFEAADGTLTPVHSGSVRLTEPASSD